MFTHCTLNPPATHHLNGSTIDTAQERNKQRPLARPSSVCVCVCVRARARARVCVCVCARRLSYVSGVVTSVFFKNQVTPRNGILFP